MSTMLDTRTVSLADRPGYWSAGIAEHFFPVHVESFDGESFDARLTGGQVGPLYVRTISGHPHRIARTARQVAGADPECILLYLVRHGSCRIEQDGHGCDLRPGEIAAHDTSRPSYFEAPTGFEVLVFSFPKWFLGGIAPVVGDLAATRVGGPDTPLVRLAAPLFGGIANAADRGGLHGPDADRAAETLLPLIRGLYNRDEGTAQRSDLLLRRIQAYVRAHLRDPSLGPDEIARAHHMSVRYVHKLFAPLGGASAWIRQQRLASAAEELRTTGHPVGEIASSWGYRDAASFARAFRRSHGLSPRELRRAS